MQPSTVFYGLIRKFVCRYRNEMPKKLLNIIVVFSLLLSFCHSPENKNAKNKSADSSKQERISQQYDFKRNIPSFTYYENVEKMDEKAKAKAKHITIRPKSFIRIIVPEKISYKDPYSFNEKDQKIKKRNNLTLNFDKESKVQEPVILSIHFDNDVYFQTDYYYTNGITFELIHPQIESSFISKFLWPFDNYPEVYYGLRFTHKMYTPTRLDVEEVLIHDRPFAGYFSLTHFKISFDPIRKSKLGSSLGIGFMGPAALGGQLQDFIHDDIPVGWVNQLGNDLVFDYSISFDKSIFASNKFEIINSISGNAGSLYNKLRAGFSLNFGNYSLFNSIRGFNFHKLNKKLNYGIFLKANGELIGYDATLQGGLLNRSSIYTMGKDELKSLRYNFSSGFIVQYRKMSFQARANYFSPDFKGGRPHKWLHLSLSFLMN